MRGNPDGSPRRVFDPPYEGKPGWFSLIARAAEPQALLSFRYIDGINSGEFRLATIGSN
jgi:hypothetical protein